MVLTTKEAAEYLKLSVGTVKNLLKASKLNGYRVGKNFRFFKEDLDNAIKKGVFKNEQSDSCRKTGRRPKKNIRANGGLQSSNAKRQRKTTDVA